MILLAGDAEFNNVILKPVTIISIDTWDSAGNSKQKQKSTYLPQFCESPKEKTTAAQNTTEAHLRLAKNILKISKTLIL